MLLVVEVLVGELLAVDRLSAAPVPAREIPTLQHGSFKTYTCKTGKARF